MNTNQYPDTVKVIPNRTINGFIKGKVYKCKHVRNGLYETKINSVQGVRYISIDISKDDTGKSAHLWDSVNWSKAGKFIIVK